MCVSVCARTPVPARLYVCVCAHVGGGQLERETGGGRGRNWFTLLRTPETSLCRAAVCWSADGPEHLCHTPGKTLPELLDPRTCHQSLEAYHPRLRQRTWRLGEETRPARVQRQRVAKLRLGPGAFPAPPPRDTCSPNSGGGWGPLSESYGAWAVAHFSWTSQPCGGGMPGGTKLVPLWLPCRRARGDPPAQPSL